jgi:hypothetical protein
MFKILAIAALSTSALYTATVQSAFAANDVQYIDCHFANPNSTDRVVVSADSRGVGRDTPHKDEY